MNRIPHVFLNPQVTSEENDFRLFENSSELFAFLGRLAIIAEEPGREELRAFLKDLATSIGESESFFLASVKTAAFLKDSNTEDA